MSIWRLAVGAALILTVLAVTGIAPGATPGATPAVCPATSGATPASATSERSVSVTDNVTIRLTDHGFAPAKVEATNGHPLTIHLVNQGSRPHGFRVAHFGIDVILAPGAKRTVTIDAPDLGEYPFTSGAPCDAYLRGLLIFYI